MAGTDKKDLVSRHLVKHLFQVRIRSRYIPAIFLEYAQGIHPAMSIEHDNRIVIGIEPIKERFQLFCESRLGNILDTFRRNAIVLERFRHFLATVRRTNVSSRCNTQRLTFNHVVTGRIGKNGLISRFCGFPIDIVCRHPVRIGFIQRDRCIRVLD